MPPINRILQRRRKEFIQPPWWASDPFESWSSWSSWTSLNGDKETIDGSFESYIERGYKSNGIVFACILARLLVFSEARFQWRRYNDQGRPAELFRSADLSLIEKPWPGGTTSEALARLEQDGSLAGNGYLVKVGDGTRLRRVRPDWMSIVTGSPSDNPFDLEARVVGYLYHPRRGPNPVEPTLLTPERVVHYSPIPDPDAQWRGMSWLTPVINEITADSAATRHKLKYFQNGAIPGVIMSYDKTISPSDFQEFVNLFAQSHEGVDNAYKTLHLGGGADPKVLGANLQQLDFKVTQGAGETRIAAAAGVHPVIVGLSEGLAGASLNAGNFTAARRRFSDGTIRPLWRIAAASLQSVLTVPDGAHLWYDDRDIAFLRQDAKEEADIQKTEAETIRQLTDGGYTHESVIAAISAGDWTLLKHSGLFSVQLQPPGAVTPSPATP